jgi:hypothetical protein
LATTNPTLELAMNPIIDLTSELLIDRSRIRSPHLRLLLNAIGEEFAKGSPWIVLDKKVASQYGIFDRFTRPPLHCAAA